ncbi:MAG TPA: hypothetical protein VEX86_10830 [Longimicrobium sp.]|nr:hypothetical protein [Longimicrobium sp.]
MTDVEAQIHHKFKVFTGSGADVGQLGMQAEAFVRERQVAAKSIGVEYLEGAGKLVLTLGYRDDEPGYEVRISSRSVGVVDGLDDLGGLEARMGEAAGNLAGVLCHELFVTDAGEFVMVFMAKA